MIEKNRKMYQNDVTQLIEINVKTMKQCKQHQRGLQDSLPGRQEWDGLEGRGQVCVFRFQLLPAVMPSSSTRNKNHIV